MKQLIRRHARQIAGVCGAAVLLTAMSILITGTDHDPLLEPTAVSLATASPEPLDVGLAGPSFTPSPSPTVSASPSPSASGVPFTEIDGIPEAATVDQVNTAIGLAIGAILLALVAVGLAGVTIARQPSGGGEDYEPDPTPNDWGPQDPGPDEWALPPPPPAPAGAMAAGALGGAAVAEAAEAADATEPTDGPAQPEKPEKPEA